MTLYMECPFSRLVLKSVDGAQYTLKGTVTLVPGDNLASQCLGGYKSLASTLRKCRQCMAVNEDMQTKVRVLYKCMCQIKV